MRRIFPLFLAIGVACADNGTSKVVPGEETLRLNVLMMNELAEESDAKKFHFQVLSFFNEALNILGRQYEEPKDKPQLPFSLVLRERVLVESKLLNKPKARNLLDWATGAAIDEWRVFDDAERGRLVRLRRDLPITVDIAELLRLRVSPETKIVEDFKEVVGEFMREHGIVQNLWIRSIGGNSVAVNRRSRVSLRYNDPDRKHSEWIKNDADWLLLHLWGAENKSEGLTSPAKFREEAMAFVTEKERKYKQLCDREYGSADGETPFSIQKIFYRSLPQLQEYVSEDPASWDAEYEEMQKRYEKMQKEIVLKGSEGRVSIAAVQTEYYREIINRLTENDLTKLMEAWTTILRLSPFERETRAIIAAGRSDPMSSRDLSSLGRYYSFPEVLKLYQSMWTGIAEGRQESECDSTTDGSESDSTTDSKDDGDNAATTRSTKPPTQNAGASHKMSNLKRRTMSKPKRRTMSKPKRQKMSKLKRRTMSKLKRRTMSKLKRRTMSKPTRQKMSN